MEVFILCGGFGTRLDHQSKLIAKPMVRIGKEPILYYIMENFAKQNMNTFVLCLGYKKETIFSKNWKILIFSCFLSKIF